jgi:hypothetical protein
MSSVYNRPEPGEWFEFEGMTDQRLSCCDCGLVHGLDFRVASDGVNHYIQMRAWRDNRSTGQMRRHMRERGELAVNT